MIWNKAEIEKFAVHKGVITAFPSEHLMFSVENSASKLRMAWYNQLSDGPEYEYSRLALFLGGRPLVKIQANPSPTCESLLAAGYGLPSGGPFTSILEKLYRPYDGLPTALSRLQPLLALLEPGIYILSYSEYCPTDGSGRFFWDVPAEETLYQSTAELYDSGYQQVLPAFPCFLYPSQSAQAYQPERAEYYRGLIRAGKDFPPALVYSLWGYMGILLDGHHRASACALEGKRLPCLTISKPGRIWRNGVSLLQWPDKSETPISELLPTGKQSLLSSKPHNMGETGLFQNAADACQIHWPHVFADEARYYPNCWEAGTMARYPQITLDAEGLNELASGDDYEDPASAARLLFYLSRQKGADIKKLAFPFIEKGCPYEMRVAAFQILDAIQGDAEIDDLMIKILVYEERKDDAIYQIADKHWR